MRIFYSILLTLLSVAAFGQSKADLKKIEDIKQRSSQYVIGEGYAADQASADQMAIGQLLTNISANVEADINLAMNQEQFGEDNSSTAIEARNRTRIKSYGKVVGSSSITVRQKDGTFFVFRYLERTKLEQMYKKREEKAKNYCREADKNLEKGQIGYALKNFYWSLCLLRSIPNGDEVDFFDEGRMQKFINRKMNTIFQGLKTQVGETQGDRVKLLFTYDGKNVKDGFDFIFYNGKLTSHYTAKDGVAEIKVPASFTAEQFHIKYDYEYSEAANADEDVSLAVNMYKGKVIAGADNYIPRGTKKEVKLATAQIEQVMNEETNAVHNALEKKEKKSYANIVFEVVEAIKQRNYSSVRHHFTPDGYGMLDTLMTRYGSVSVVGSPELQCYQMLDKVVCRSVPMQFTFRGGRKSFREDVTFTFNKDEKIEGLAFSLGKQARDNIFQKNAMGIWSDSVCMVIATFLENYKTAFALKRTSYIETMFSDEAVIITGTVLKKSGKKLDNNTIQFGDLVEYSRQNKAEYITNLAQNFKGNEYININFTDSDVKKSRKGERYGINIKQEYFSSTYGDTGYLFLYVDFEEPDKPLIYFRSWSPEKGINKEWPISMVEMNKLGI